MVIYNGFPKLLPRMGTLEADIGRNAEPKRIFKQFGSVKSILKKIGLPQIEEAISSQYCTKIHSNSGLHLARILTRCTCLFFNVLEHYFLLDGSFIYRRGSGHHLACSSPAGNPGPNM
ncbi:hypothetical protein AVEN_140211-1 [Araneus ventricosus]|uniref:Uncharacterized protein n=1 Tax=Araneus ventricosus TaxID=182803 RepID=A0A4Y2I7H3_ARAVE|nr:hypothetical protein AVEN_140211-1 [Araneus ventricosus]